MGRKGLVGGVGLVALGATLAVAVTHVNVSWKRGEAAPAAAVVADVKPALPPPSTAQLTEARSLGRTFAQVASQLSPSVVRISIAKTVKAPRGMGGGRNPFQGTPFERYFGQGDGDDDGGMPGQKQRGMGSGVVIDSKGYILTNNHVVEDADEVKVAFADGKTVPGKVIGTDPKSDLAVVKVDGVAVKAAKFGDSEKLQVGEWTIAIGNPFGLDHTVTVGVLSAKGRSGFGKTQYEDFLQTDASINPGNSGGPLVNLDGEIIGINTMIAGMGTGIGFAVPSSMAKPVVEQLINGGKVRRPYIGIMMQDLAPEMAKALGDKAPERGAIVGQVQPGSPADRAGVKAGDVIVKVDGASVDGSRAVQRTILTKQIGQKVELAVWRDGHEQKLATTTAELPGEPGETRRAAAEGAQRGRLGLGLQNLTPQISQQLELPRGMRGAVIANVRPGSPADEAGVREGDVLVEVDRRPVTSAEDATKLLGQDRSSGHLLRIQRKDSALYLVIQPGT
jgi:serine protease Do